MKIIKTASGKQTIKMSKKEWEAFGKKAGWMRTAQAIQLAWCSAELSRDQTGDPVITLRDARNAIDLAQDDASKLQPLFRMIQENV